jgi:catechol 2,3-dioxygenase-like lactoylglutathione lyase family enzyme
VRLDLVTLVVPEYDEAIRFFVDDVAGNAWDLLGPPQSPA